MLYILYIKPSNRVLFGALRLIISSGHLEYTEFRSSHNFCNMFYMFISHFYTAYVTPSVATHLQHENIHITFVNGNNARIDVMALPKSSLCTYTSANIPMYVMKLHIITVIMYTT